LPLLRYTSLFSLPHSSSFSRIKIARNAAADDINLSIQYLLNCGTDVAGSCSGGTHSGAYQFIHESGFVPYDTCQPYLACSENSTFGICPFVDTSCNPSAICKTCTMKLVPSIHPFSEICREIDSFPNATIAEYGTITMKDEEGSAVNVMQKVKAEIFARGPVAAAVYGKALHEYRGGIISDDTAPTNSTHVVSLVGWGTNAEDGTTYYIARNSWGTFYGGTC
jgi:cathepsin X